VGQELIVPGTGEVVDLDDEVATTRAIIGLREFEAQIAAVKRELTEAVKARMKVLGVKTLTLPDGSKASLSGGPTPVYDAEAIEVALRKAGMPEDRIREIVVERVSYTVAPVMAKQAAAANPRYAKAIAKNRTMQPGATYVTVKK
jgi:hypothetical protein